MGGGGGGGGGHSCGLMPVHSATKLRHDFMLSLAESKQRFFSFSTSAGLKVIQGINAICLTIGEPVWPSGKALGW